MMKAINMEFPVILVGLVFLGLVTFTCLANTAVLQDLAALEHRAGMAMNSNRSAAMDRLSPHLGNFYFWIPFHFGLILLLAGLDRVKFSRNFLFLLAYLMFTVWCAVGMNAINAWLYPVEGSQSPYAFTASSRMDAGWVCVNAALSFGSAVFICLFLSSRFMIIKLLLLSFSLLISYNLIYMGNDLLFTILRGMGLGTVSALICNNWFRRIQARSNLEKLKSK